MKLKKILCSILLGIIGLFTVCMLNERSIAAEGKYEYNFYREGKDTDRIYVNSIDQFNEFAVSTEKAITYSNATNCRQEMYWGFTLGTAKKTGSFTITLSTSVNKITIFGTKKDSSSTFKVNGNEASSGELSTNKTTLEDVEKANTPLVWEFAEAVSEVKIETNEKRATIYKLILENASSTVSYDVAFYDGTTEYEDLRTSVEEGSVITRPTDPVKEGFVFEGWYSDSTLETAYDFTTTVTSETTLYAKFTDATTVTTWSVYYNDSGDSNLEPSVVVDGNLVTKPQDPVREGYVFDGWYIDEVYSEEFNFDNPITSDVNLYAKWTQMFTVSFDTLGGTSISNINVAPGNTITKPTDPTKTDYQFGGWYTTSTYETEFDFTLAINSNTTIYAKWIDQNLVVFDDMEFSKVSTVEEITDGFYLIGSKNNNTRVYMTDEYNGNKLLGSNNPTTYFHIEKIGDKFQIRNTKGELLFLNSSEVEFSYNTENDTQFEINVKSDMFTLNTSTKYLKYNKDTNNFRTYKESSGCINIYLYKANQEFKTVKFDVNGEEYAKVLVKPNTVVTNIGTPVITDYNFIDWCSDENTSELFDFNSVITEDTTIYAKLEPTADYAIFETLNTQAGLNFHYSIVDGVVTVDNIEVRFGIENMTATAYNSNASYGVLVVQKDLLLDDKNQTISFNTLCNDYKDGLTTDELVELLSDYDVKKYDLTPELVGEGYNFATVFTDMDGSENVEVSAIIYMELNGQVYLMNSRTTSVVNRANEYIATGDYSGDILLALETIAKIKNGGQE